jgi:repressor LexA
MESLTARQAQILALIRTSIEKTGFPPTRAEIADRLGFRSPNAAEEHLRALQRKGMIEVLPGTARGIRLKSAAAKYAPPRYAAPKYASPKGSERGAIPLIGRVAAGAPILAAEHVIGHYQVDGALFKRSADYLLKVRGLSMRDAGILDGDLLAVHRTQEARSGQIVVARLADEVTVKRLRSQRDRIELVPANPDFPTIVVDPKRDVFAIEGVAVGLLRNVS